MKGPVSSVPRSLCEPAAAARAADRRRALVAAILLASFLLYAPSLANDFTWDDRHAAMGSGPTKQPLVATLHPLGDYFASNWWPQHAPGATAYRPLTTLWFALRHAVCGDHALVAHLLNVLLHTTATGLVHLLLRALGVPFAAAAIGTTIFGLHALHSEAVANLVGGAELLALTFGLSGTLALLSGARAERQRTFAAWLGIAAACWFLAVAAKESGLAWTVFAPLCVVARSWHRRGLPMPNRRRWLAIGAAACAVAAAWSWLRAGMIARLPAGGDVSIGLLENPLLGVTPLLRAASGMLAWGQGLLQVLLPHSLCCDYGPDQLPVVRDLASPWAIASGVVTAAFVLGFAVVARRARSAPLIALAVACFAASSFLLTNVPMPVFMHFAERSYTTPSLGLAIAAAAIAPHCRTRNAKHWGTAGLGLWLAWSIATAVPRNFVWADDATLVAHDCAASPRSVRLHLSLGVTRRERGDVAAAERHFRTASELAPDLPQPWLELAACALRRGDLAAARDLAERAANTNEHDRARFAPVLHELQLRLAAAAAATPR